MKRRLSLLALLGVLISATPAWAEPDAPPTAKRGPGPERDKECLVCHAGLGEEEAPKLDLPLFQRSAHGQEGCVGCHADVEDPDLKHEEEDQDLAPVACGTCHEHEDGLYKASQHANPMAAKRANKDQALCKSCHGMHDILPPTDPKSRTHPLRQLETCGQCHGTHRTAAGHAFEIPEEHKAAVAEGEPKQIEALMAAGELLKASCSDCHGDHKILPSAAEGSALHPTVAPETCGKCHREQREQYEESEHWRASHEPGFVWDTRPAEERPEGAPLQPPVCHSCHAMHAGSLPKSAKFRLDLVKECGTCHEHLMETYVQSYHGKATLLGDATAAKCSDCHGYHSILGIDEVGSQVNSVNKLKTCQKCHEGAPPKFAGFWAHADHHDKEQFPALYWIFVFMTTLLISVFTFFGLHTLMWAIREGVEAMQEGSFIPKHKPSGPRIQRFNAVDRTVHLFVVISFLGLAFTGAPLKFAAASWAPAVFALVGGVNGAGLLHRIFAVITFGYFITHVATLAKRFWGFKQQGILFSKLIGPDSLVPRPSDVTDVIANIRYFIGAGKKPTWDRWTYWEKFDYWAVFWGVAIIGGSGLIMWFPEVFTQVLPGWSINIALVVHSDEALLAIGFIFGIHFFNGHLRRSKFPMDEVIFTGSIPMDEFKDERGRQYARDAGRGAVEGKQVSPPSMLFRVMARVFGIAAWITGLIILALIIHGFITT
jgi:cytochrome b subunit of formate dehydrogenase